MFIHQTRKRDLAYILQCELRRVFMLMAALALVLLLTPMVDARQHPPPPVVISPDFSGIQLGLHTELLRDSTNKPTIAQV